MHSLFSVLNIDMAPQGGPPETIYDMNKIEDVKVKNDSSVEKNPGCCKQCTDKIILSLENCFAK